MPDEIRTVRIVVIEDYAPDVLLIGECLAGSSVPFEIVHFDDGEAALTGLRGTVKGGIPPDLILVDLNMPKVNGLDVLRAIKGESALSGVPVVVLTSSAAPEEREEAELIGADRFLRKPFDLYEFIDQVGGIVRELIPAVKDSGNNPVRP
jgi:CheY-like chemotaxis protein